MPKFVSGSSNSTTTNTTSNSTVVTKPTSVSSGNLLVALVYVRGNATSGAVVTPPSGWTVASPASANGTIGFSSVYTRVAGASEPSTYTWANTSTSITALSVMILNFTGATVLDGNVVFSSVAVSGVANIPAITPTGSADMWLSFAYGNNNGTFSTPSGFTAQTALSNSSIFLAVAAFTEQLSSSATTTATSSTNSGSSGAQGVSILLSPNQPVFVSGNSAGSGSSALTTSAPAGIVAGNLLVAEVYCQGVTGTIPTPTGGSTWVLQGTQFSNATDGCMAVFAKVAGASEPGSYTTNGIASSLTTACVIKQYTNTVGLDGVPVLTANASTGSAPSVSPGVGNLNNLWIAAYGNSAGDTFTTPTGFTARTLIHDTLDGVSLYSFEKQLTTSAATGTAASTNQGDPGVGCSYLIAPLGTKVASGAVIQSGTSKTPTKITTKIGNAVLLTMGYSGTNTASVSGGGCTWTNVVTKTNATMGGGTEIWLGVVTATGSNALTISFSSSPTQFDQASLEFDSQLTSAFTWTVRSASFTDQGTTAAHPVTFPSLTATAGDTYFGGSVCATTGTLSGSVGIGFTFELDGNGDVSCYNPTIPSTGATTVTDGSGTSQAYIAVGALIYPGAAAVPPPFVATIYPSGVALIRASTR